MGGEGKKRKIIADRVPLQRTPEVFAPLYRGDVGQGGDAVRGGFGPDPVGLSILVMMTGNRAEAAALVDQTGEGCQLLPLLVAFPGWPLWIPECWSCPARLFLGRQAWARWISVELRVARRWSQNISGAQRLL